MTNDTLTVLLLIFCCFGLPVIWAVVCVMWNEGFKVEEHKVFHIILLIISIGSIRTMIITGSNSKKQLEQETAAKSTKSETILKETGLSDLQNYFENELDADDIIYNKETKKIIIGTNESSSADTIAKIDKKLAGNDKIKSVDFTRAGGKGGLIILIINLK